MPTRGDAMMLVFRSAWAHAVDISCTKQKSRTACAHPTRLLIVRVRKQLQEVFSRSLPVVELFQYPTIHALAEHLDRSPEKQPENQDKQATEKARKGRKAAAKRQRQRRQRR